jgi:hypothetical protein
MTELRITPNEASKKLAIEGRIAAGEHIQLTLVGYASKATDSELRLRVLFGDKTVAMFPLIETDSWTIEGNDATCVLNLNTDRAAKLLKFGGECMWVLDDVSIYTLYGMKAHYVGPWPKDSTDNLDSVPSKVEELEGKINEEIKARRNADTDLDEKVDGVSDTLDEVSTILTNKLNKVTTGLDEIGTKYTLKDVKNKVNEIIAILKGEA